MNRSRYLEIYQQLAPEINPNAITIYFIQNIFLAAASAAIVWLSHGGWTKLFAVPFVLTFIYRNFSFMHEAVHNLGAKSKFANDFLGAVSGSFCLLSYESWKKAHLEHHQWGGNIDKDPVMAMVKVFPAWPKGLRDVLTLGWKAWIPALSVLQHTVFWAISVKHFVGGTKTKSDVMSIVIPIAVWSGLFYSLSLDTLTTVVAPSLFLYLVFTEVVNAPHHLGLPQFRGDIKLPFWHQYLIARTCVYPKWLARYVVLNFNYHIEHHMYPQVPWYYLDKLHPLVKAELGPDYNTDPQFAWILRNRARTLGEIFVITQPVQLPEEDKKAA